MGINQVTINGASIVTYPNRVGEVAVVDTGYPYGDVRRHGVLGDGTNEATRVQNAIASAQALGGTVLGAEGLTIKLGTQLTASDTIRIDWRGAVLLCDVTGPVINGMFTGNQAKPTFSMRGGVFKWNGTFGTSLAGGFYLQDWANVVIEENVFWGLGAPILATGFNANVTVRNNHIAEHGAADIVAFGKSAGSPVYVATIVDNFFHFTAATAYTHDGVSGPCRNLTVRNNAFEASRNHIWLKQGVAYQVVVENNFFEDGVCDVVLGTDYGTGFFDNLKNVRISENSHNPHAGASTGVKVDGIVRGLTITNNDFFNTVAVAMNNPRNFGLRIGQNNYDAATTPLTGYPNITESLQQHADVLCIDQANDSSAWTKDFDPSGTGVLTTVAGPNGGRSVQATVTGNQLVVKKALPTLDLTSYDYFVVLVYIDDPTKIKFYASGNPADTIPLLNVFTDGANFYQYKLQAVHTGNAPTVVKGWNSLVLKKSDAIANGAPAWATITAISITDYPDTGNTVTFMLGGFFAVKLLEGGPVNPGSLLWRAGTMQLGIARITIGNAAPTTGYWPKGSRVIAETPAAGTVYEWVCIAGGTPGTWVPLLMPGNKADAGDANLATNNTVTPWKIRYTVPLTANRTVTLNAGAYDGQTYHIERWVASTGAFTVDVGGLKSLAVGQWCDMSWDGGAWRLQAFGSL